jgi:7-cyano-7-deazaguanine synthase in queuosine biosynthesis
MIGTESALVLFSGGQDSAACLAWALAHFAHVETIGFDYALSLAVPKTRPDLLQRLDAAIAALPLLERTEIQQRWMGPLYASELMAPKRPPLLWVAAGLLVLAALLGSVLAWRRRARAAVGVRPPGTP